MMINFNSYRQTILWLCIWAFSFPVMGAEKNVDAAEQLLVDAQPLIENFTNAERWAAVKNLTGSAKAVVIIPSGYQGGLLFGYEGGNGMLLVRHGYDWSDPIFIRLNAYQFGLLIGLQKFGAAGAVLSDAALQQVLNGKMRLGASGDLTAGIGFSGRAAGGSSGGIQLLMVSSNKGLFLGGNIESVGISINDKLNQIAYGASFDAEYIAGRTGGRFLPSDSLREILKQSTYEAIWGAGTYDKNSD